ncbi:hypothetical protein PP353_gp54 [Arthrobacter phage Kumotta]|uniref:Uncharacterized protein n=2 Tax=Kumottavirus TaxID=3044749 RepID=A0A4Y6ELH0_9CAUD|nr:hypothetical protein PP353_gp54 [Arthrobacter phage Kumotta]YP_010649532.1 hypothetical protein PP356_gp50 [Arthrobacter phage MargaretKali]AXH44430.1 hypothetical protein SEA_MARGARETKALI_50 [Arthrobacter phage MargaretKali]QDF19563.1 hypothetical protein SEA_KUMOTTA_54 [Arthrobacter phage Kumotta]
MTIRKEGIVNVSIHAGELEATGNSNEGVYQIRMGYTNHIHITPERAAQWINVLTPIAKEAE